MLYKIIYFKLILLKKLYKKRLNNLRVNLINFAGKFKYTPVELMSIKKNGIQNKQIRNQSIIGFIKY